MTFRKIFTLRFTSKRPTQVQLFFSFKKKQNKTKNAIYLPNYELTSYVIFSNCKELVLSLTALNGSFYYTSCIPQLETFANYFRALSFPFKDTPTNFLLN